MRTLVLCELSFMSGCSAVYFRNISFLASRGALRERWLEEVLVPGAAAKSVLTLLTKEFSVVQRTILDPDYGVAKQALE